MTTLPGTEATALPLWTGRRGVVNAVMCCVVSLPCAFGLWFFAERSTIVPACAAYASQHGMTYSDFKLVGVKHASTVVCLLEGAGGKRQEQRLEELVPFFTNVAVELAMTLEITVPAFVILLALLRVGVYRAGARSGGPRPDAS